MTRRHIGWAFALAGVLLVSLDALWVRWSELSGWEASILASIFALPMYLVLGRVFDDKGPVTTFKVAPRALLTISVLAATSQISFISALTRTSVANVAIMVGAVPITASIAGWLIAKERPSRRVLIAVIVVFIGIVIVMGGSVGEPRLGGDLLSLLAVTSFSINLALWRRNVDASRYVALALSSVIVIAVAAVFASPFGHEPRAYLALGAMGLIANSWGRVLNTTATKYVSASEVGLFTPIETVAASAWGWLAFSEVPAVATWIGGGLILAAVVYGTILGRHDADLGA